MIFTPNFKLEFKFSRNKQLSLSKWKLWHLNSGSKTENQQHTHKFMHKLVFKTKYLAVLPCSLLFILFSNLYFRLDQIKLKTRHKTVKEHGFLKLNDTHLVRIRKEPAKHIIKIPPKFGGHYNPSKIISRNTSKITSHIHHFSHSKPKPLLLPANISISHNNWVILAFCDVDQIPLAEIWYSQLTKLGYQQHMIASLDTSVFQHFESINKRVYSATPKLPKNKRLKAKYISSIRVNTVFNFLNDGYNLFISGIENIWVKYRDLSTLPNKFDTYFGACSHQSGI